MKKIIGISLAICAFACLNAQAQDSAKHFIGIKAGLSIPNLKSGGSVKNELNTGYSSSIGPNFAVFYECLLNKKFSLVTQLEYAAEGGKKNGFQAFPNANDSTGFNPYLYADFNSRAKLNYLMLSELAKVQFPLGKHSPMSIYFEAGPFVGLLVSAHQITSGTSDIYADKGKQVNISEMFGMPPQSFDDNTDIKDQLHKGNFGIEGGIGFAMNMKSSKLFIEGGGNYGFLNIQKGTENGKNHIGAATLRLGYAFSL